MAITSAARTLAHLQPAARPLGREIALTSGFIFVILLAVSVAIAAVLYWNERRTQSAILKNNQRQQVDALGQGIVGHLETVASALLVLGDCQTLAALLAEDTASTRANLADEFRRFVNRKRVYDQMRYIDHNGQEMVRVNLRDGAAEIVAESDLQSKKDRYYFQQAWPLGRDEIYVSPFDLNVENGQIEQPPKPTIRFATVVFDADGRRRGVLVINYLGQHLLHKLQRAARGRPGQVMLLNADGYWLQGPRPEDEWAFMDGDRRNVSFAATHPNAWARMAVEEECQLQSTAGLFTFTTVHPIPPQSSQGYHWKLVSLVAHDELATQSARVLSGILGLLGGVTILLLGVSWLLGWSLVHQREARRRLADGQRLAAIGSAMTALAHESRNALQRSQAGLEMLGRRLPASEDAQELIAEVQEAQYHLRDLYEQARDWAAPLQLQREKVNLGRLASDVWQQLEQQRAGRCDTLDVDSAVYEANCLADRRLLSQVFRNIFENSLAAADPTHIQVQNNMNPANDSLRISITDDGPGLSAEERHRIFEPFFTMRTRGTGLGMAISRRIVEAHGGTISAESPNGSQRRGTTIVIELPREAA